MDILLDPCQRKSLIEYPGINDTVSENFVRCQEAKGTQLCCRQSFDSGLKTRCAYSILNGNANKTVIVGLDDGSQVLSTIPLTVTTPVNPYQDR